MKPRIWFGLESRRYLCARLGMTTLDVLGLGNTPLEAYNNWKEKNLCRST